jgi:hypothetical protein
MVAARLPLLRIFHKLLEDKGYHVYAEWLRFNHVLSKPLLGFCRLVGLTRYEKKDGIRIGYQNSIDRKSYPGYTFIYNTWMHFGCVFFASIQKSGKKIVY